MSKGKDFRPRKRGFDDDGPMDYGNKPGRQARSPFGGGFPPPDIGMPSTPTVDATVKWFKGDKGFGFVELADGAGDAFLAAFLCSLLRTAHTDTGMLSAACRLGEWVAAHPGATPDYDTTTPI